MEIIDRLKETKAETLRYFSLGEDELNKSYGPGKWNVRQLLHHLADAESVLYDRIRRGISKPGQVIWGFDQDAWCDGLNYNDGPLDLNKEVYTSVRDMVIFYARQHYEGSENKTFVHSESGKRSLKNEFDKVVLHNQHHLNQIKLALSM